MKNSVILFMLIALFISEKASAQLNITAAIETKPERVLVCQVSYSFLYKTNGTNYEYWAKTDNQFDKNYTTLFLGDSPESALQTLNDLKSLMDNEVAAVSVQQEGGNVILTFQKQLGVKTLWIKQDGQAGKSWISYGIVKKLIEYLERVKATTHPQVGLDPQG